MGSVYIFDIGSYSGTQLNDLDTTSGTYSEIYQTSGQSQSNPEGGSGTHRIDEHEYFMVDSTPSDASDSDIVYQNLHVSNHFEQIGLSALRYDDANGNSITVSPPAGGISFAIVLNTETGQAQGMFHFSTEEAATWFTSIIPSDATNVTTVLGGYGSSVSTTSQTALTCFCQGTVIKTANGTTSIETLKVGDLVVTMDGGLQPIRWIGSTKVNAEQMAVDPKLWPICISADAIAPGVPSTDLRVSRQHRILIDASMAKSRFKDEAVLVSAFKLTALAGIHVDDSQSEAEFFHVLFDDHQVIYANGAPSESLLLGQEALKALSVDAVEEIQALFPQLVSSKCKIKAARFIPTNKEQKEFVRELVR